MSRIRISPLILAVVVICLLAATMGRCSRKEERGDLTNALVEVVTIPIEVRTTGELDSLQATVLTNGVHTREPSKIVKVMPDGSYVKEGEGILWLDSAGFETRLKQLNAQIEVQQAEVVAHEGIAKAEEERRLLNEAQARFAIQEAKANLDKAISGDGPKELAKRKRTLNKAEARLKNQEAFFTELVQLEKEGFLSPKEIKDAKAKQKEKQEIYEEAKSEYEHYLLHEYPHIKEVGLGRIEVAELKAKEALASGKLATMQAMADYQKERLKLIELKNEQEECVANLAACKVCAPKEGLIVLAREFFGDRKRKLRVGDPIFYGQPLAEMPDPGSMAVKTKIRERDLEKIGPGSLATITVDACPGATLQGEIISIGGVSEGDIPGEKAFEVTVAIDAMEALRPGMTARCILIGQEATGCCVIPLQAVFHSPQGPYCYKQVGSRYQITPVNMGRSGDDLIQVTSGLKKGDRVALQPPSRIRK